jgi:hypothetical protein
LYLVGTTRPKLCTLISTLCEDAKLAVTCKRVGGPTYADGEVGRENTLEIVPEDVVGTIPANSGTVVLREVVYDVTAPENVDTAFEMFVFAML